MIPAILSLCALALSPAVMKTNSVNYASHLMVICVDSLFLCLPRVVSRVGNEIDIL